MQRSMSRYRGSSKSRCSCTGVYVDADVRVDVGGDGRRKNCLSACRPVCLFAFGLGCVGHGATTSSDLC